ncbi:hypothetical protein VOLCADRAFT_93337 [Volvox carteri f. nagariensis]|uniref:SRCR domain-containing protein n=1 Tax=Volvox carteri f. nagariensis TaxID=3068 RepID=D8U1V7_VOLCA|nr:uncharacterized protein VOLCADRAFT_93337 [Volvox carteri f. nagariensis]EFJ46246.1 hypothetical protein VOLCADRAFT_93337 [Volvox carteri f. nagariensis]|eukprot:XP_002952693.1 hypothetical protein VOLCADRAFT_93337 [Volvox carteri f. nagariensis]
MPVRRSLCLRCVLPILFYVLLLAAARVNRTKNGLRLVRGRGGIGRLEARVVPDFFLQTGYSQNGGWAPLCDDGSFDDQQALVFCKIMGYKFGRKHYRNGISTNGHDEPEPRPSPLGHLTCNPLDQSWPSFPVGKIDLPDSLDMKCLLFVSSCAGRRLVALQCSDKPLKPKPPPPPSPPTPRMRHAIKMIPLEDNLLAAWQPSGLLFSEPLRIELLVNTSTSTSTSSSYGADGVDAVANSKPGVAVWAPLCVSASQAEALKLLGSGQEVQVIANTSCHQYEDFPNSWFSWMVGKEQTPVNIPTDASPSDDKSPMFDPSLYTHWATVVGGAVEGRLSLQQMQLQVSTEPCETGLMFVATCDTLIV